MMHIASVWHFLSYLGHSDPNPSIWSLGMSTNIKTCVNFIAKKNLRKADWSNYATNIEKLIDKNMPNNFKGFHSILNGAAEKYISRFNKFPKRSHIVRQ